MTFEIRIDEIAQNEIEEFIAFQREYSAEFAEAQIDRLVRIFEHQIAQAPFMWGFFFVTGAPYHAYLFRIGRRTSYWIVYTIDEAAQRVNVLRFWNSSRDEKAFEI